jgi:uncharacterized membrane protein YphA (DoxX/SURF4 family)
VSGAARTAPGARALRVGLQVLIGGVTVASAIGKALDLPGFVRVIETYQLLPPALFGPVAVAVLAGELVLGAWILSGWRLAPAALLAVAMYLAWAVLLTLTLLRGLELQNCGCFGIFLARPLRWYSPLEDVLAMGLSGLLHRLARRT